MKIGDLVALRWGEGKRAAGMIVEKFVHNLADRDYIELRIRWLDDTGKDVSWVRPKDLEIVSEGR